MICWKCRSKLDLINKKIGFRDSCEKCFADLHVCKNCRYYSIGKPNDCEVPLTEFVSDREKYNFCEEFRPKENFAKEKKISKEDIEKKLFGK
jgi:hypothetical protein